MGQTFNVFISAIMTSRHRGCRKYILFIARAGVRSDGFVACGHDWDVSSWQFPSGDRSRAGWDHLLPTAFVARDASVADWGMCLVFSLLQCVTLIVISLRFVGQLARLESQYSSPRFGLTCYLNFL